MPIEVRLLPFKEFLYFLKLKAMEMMEEGGIFKLILDEVFRGEHDILLKILESKKFKINY